jgi:hypothetical protein
MKLTDLINEEKYTIIDPKGNPAGTGTKDQANQRQKKLGGSKKGYFVVPAKKALKARRTLEKYKFDFKSTKLQDLMSDLYFESMNEAVSKTYKIPTQRGTLHIEVEEDTAGVMVDVIFNRVDLSTTDIQFPTGDVEITKRKKKVKLKESVNEGASTEEKRIVMMAIKKIAKYRNVPLHFAVNDVIRAAEELERTIGKK